MITCVADCFVDSCHAPCIRPIAQPMKLVWKYFHVAGEPAGTIESREFGPCLCGCDRLVASPAVDIDTHRSMKNYFSADG